MLKKKRMVQKTFRLDADINNDFEDLCEILERTQNDLANVAIEELLEQNKFWLARQILVDYTEDFFCNDNNAEFEIEGIYVNLKYKDDKTIILEIAHKDENGETLDTFKKEYDCTKDSNYYEEIVEKLRDFGSLINPNSESVKMYLKNKLNYK